jgi:transcriptional regulator with XRE-family HTH domain
MRGIMSEYGDALGRYKLENKLSNKDIERAVNVSSSRIAIIINGGVCGEAIKKKISDGLGGIFEGLIRYKQCIVCGKDFIPRMVNAQVCSIECATERNKEMCKVTKKEKMSDRIINYREMNGVSQKQLAELIGISKQAIVDIEIGKRYADLTAKKIYDALGSDFKKFLNPSVCRCGNVFYKRRDAMNYCSTECSRKYYRPDKAAAERYKKTQKEERIILSKREIEHKVKAQSIGDFMNGKQYGDRQREYLLNLQKTQRMEIR